MRIFALCFLLLISIPASAKDIALVLSEAEQRVLIQALDAATKAGGLSVAGDMVYLLRRIQTAPEVTDTKVTPPEPKKE